jgi:hypothetical protein
MIHDLSRSVRFNDELKLELEMKSATDNITFIEGIIAPLCQPFEHSPEPNILPCQHSLANLFGDDCTVIEQFLALSTQYSSRNLHTTSNPHIFSIVVTATDDCTVTIPPQTFTISTTTRPGKIFKSFFSD